MEPPRACTLYPSQTCSIINVSLIAYTTSIDVYFFLRAIFFDFLCFDLVLTVGMVFSEMVSSSEAEELDELVTVFLAMYDLLQGRRKRGGKGGHCPP